MTPIATQRYMPWAEPVTVTSVRPNAADVVTAAVPAGCYRNGVREPVPSNGVYVLAAATFTVATTDLPYEPKAGDTVAWLGDVYVVLGVDGSDWLQFRDLDCVCPKIIPDRADACTLKRPASAPTAGGLRQFDLAVVAENFPCRFQPAGGVEVGFDADTDRTETTSRFVCYLGTPVGVLAGDVIETAAGVRYAVTGSAGVARLAELPAVSVERID